MLYVVNALSGPGLLYLRIWTCKCSVVRTFTCSVNTESIVFPFMDRDSHHFDDNITNRVTYQDFWEHCLFHEHAEWVEGSSKKKKIQVIVATNNLFP